MDSTDDESAIVTARKAPVPRDLVTARSSMAKSKVNFDTFVNLARRSGLVEGDALDQAVAEFQGAAAPSEPPEDLDRLVEFLIARKLLTRWQADKLLEGKHKGFVIGRFKLLGLIGTGGMSTVYLAEHKHLHRLSAIKVLPSNRVEDSSYLARFYREAKAAGALDDPNVVKIYDVDSDGDKIHFMVLEYVDGKDLQKYVKENGPLPYRQAADCIRQAASGLHHAHQMGLIHRDIKPGNLLLDTRGVVKVLDLGLARFSDDGECSLTREHDENVLGTADYLAPEQAIDSHTVDRRADIYSLGCTLYYLLTGHPPFAEGTLPQRLMKHQTTAPPSILIDRPDAPKGLVDICNRMMAKKPRDRYQTSAEAGEALTRWIADEERRASGSSPAAASPAPASKLPTALPVKAAPTTGTGVAVTSPVAQAGSMVTARPATKPADSLPRARPLTTSPDDTMSEARSATVKGPLTDSSSVTRRLPVARPLEGPDQSQSSIIIKTDDPIARRFESESSISGVGWRRRKQRTYWTFTAMAATAVTATALLIAMVLIAR